ncbi:flagellar basal-body MS-ring/collar protein FliF [Sporolactobacillus inulinus]|uniref:Flagellar M-ring protein n=1 Tax=Sporolactobacillus inulinus CASD TaxID=1069536 RepID=A0A0U1QLY1_9BACL|nr:flagellar basal-body MS-ring/collar protein FliF [Sporolactobacillus inulinus]KLI01824.1 flagellar MS-ring protein [Sporolactobacillus inulinus CASD]GEB75894.1 flagellar M-ring protein [Sporolactobacillus inulinus]
MKERLVSWFNRLKTFWSRIPKKNKIWMISGSAVVFAALIAILLITNIKHYTPLYSDLSENEAGQITDDLDSKSIPYKLSNGGTTISVPEKQVDQLKVELAAQGLPKTGQIDYSFFGQNAGFGMTDKQFDVLQRAAMQTELANLIANTKGVKSAKVMISLPQNDVWVSDQDKKSGTSASIVLNVTPGDQLSADQINGLYHLVAKSVPNLSVDNIVIMDQYFNYYDLKNNNANGSTLSAYDQQQAIIRDVENNVQRRVTQMLTMMMGEGKVMVNVTANVDFTQSKEKQELVEPVNQQTMEGIQTSTEHITENYTGQGAAGQAGTGTNDSQTPTYQDGTSGNGNYQKVEDRVNYEFNRIHREVTNSPYKVNDLGIQVMIEPPTASNNASLSAQSVNDVRQILNSIIKTTISDPQGQELMNNAINQKTSVTVGRFNGKPTAQPQGSKINWLWIAGGSLLALLMVGLIVWLIRRRKNDEDAETVVEDIPQQEDYQAMLNQENPEQRKFHELEEMAKEKPDQFVKLLRGWLAEDK